MKFIKTLITDLFNTKEVVVRHKIPAPITLDEAVKALDTGGYFSEKERLKIFNSNSSSDDIAVGYHMSIGMDIRNDWGLWGNSKLTHHMRDVHGIYHPDDMSGMILRIYVRNIKGE